MVVKGDVGDGSCRSWGGVHVIWPIYTDLGCELQASFHCMSMEIGTDMEAYATDGLRAMEYQRIGGHFEEGIR